MEDKLEKIFSYFTSIKNQPFYTSCISQIIQIYEFTPESLKFILYNANRLIFSNCKEVRLRLKHRLICASIVSKLNKIYVERVKSFIEDKTQFLLQNFQLESKSFVKNEEKQVRPWESFDLLQLIEKEPLLLATSKGRGELSGADFTEEEKKVFDEFLDMNHATMLNIENIFKDVEYQNEITDQAFFEKKKKYQEKINKYSKKNMELAEIQLTISNPFNLMYEICIQNLLHSEWQLRHLSVLILKELLCHCQFLGFSYTFEMSKLNSSQERFEFISNVTKQTLKKHVKQSNKKKEIMEEVISKSMELLALDRFADYQTDQSVILVRNVAAEILSIAFSSLTTTQQSKLLKIIKPVFLKDSPLATISIKSKFTWEAKHSFLYFLNVLLENNKQYSKEVCFNFEQSLIKMLANDQIDEVTIYICKVIEKFIGEPFFTQEKIDRINRQIWSVVENLDDISISAKETLKILWKLFGYFKLNQGACIERLRKFFTSKISQVRVQLYKLLHGLYQRKKQGIDGKIIQNNCVQFLQAGIIQYESQNFDKILEAVPFILPYMVKQKNMRKIVEFVNICVTPHQYTEEIILSKFIKNQSDFNNNDYLYFYEHESVHNPIHMYIDKRICKIALIFIASFQNTYQGLEEIIKGIEKNNQKNHRAKLLTLNVLASLIPSHKKNKFFEEYKENSIKMLNLEFNDVTDNQIQKIYLPELEKLLKQISTFIESHPKEIPQEISLSLKEISDSFKNGLSLKNQIQISKKLNMIYNKVGLPDKLIMDIEQTLKIYNNTIAIQKELLKNIKIMAINYLLTFVSTYGEKEIQNLNLIIKGIMDSVKEDKYVFISVKTANCIKLLTINLYKTKKNIFKKFIFNLLFNVSTNYSYSGQTMKSSLQDNTLRFQSTYMESICLYVKEIGKLIPQFLSENMQLFVEENKEQVDPNDKNKKIYILEDQYVRILTLLSGTVTSLLTIDQEGIFTRKFITKIQTIINHTHNNITLWPTIEIKVKKILKDAVLFLTKNYTKTSNTFFEWYINQMENNQLIFYEILQNLTLNNLLQISSICSIFTMQIVKSISNLALHEIVMNSLSDLIVGVYTNVKQNEFSEKLKKLSGEGIEFIKNFKDTTKFQYEFSLALKKDIQLRHYQIEGIIWLGFLTKYNLNGALCDDMGLGKTLEILYLLENQLNKNQSQIQHNLIVCPTTLVEHWAFQHAKYFQKPFYTTIILKSKKCFEEFSQMQKQHAKDNVIFITNYNLIERNVEFIEKTLFSFIILDEGHIIKNVKTNKFKAMKKLNGAHKFLLTGTPIQNRLIQLWGLFDFLMPGYLYTEQLFKKHYEKLFEVNLLTFKDDTLIFSENQKKILQKLHFKVMPFIMRRMKCDVLKELPEKIINDYYCYLTEEQHKSYDKFEKETLRIEGKHNEGEQNILANIHQMIKIVNHPYLVDHKCECKWEYSGKFIALSQLFEQCGFIEEDSLLQNKVIIFAKEKATIDLLERFLKEEHRKLNYLKLTGDTKIGDRFNIAQTFNGDSDIKVLIVTKSVGGEGLNLSSANIVIMFDSDYNPTVDMQAIDRAHRIGQKRVLNVYRLITKDTLEEKIMGIQKFKTNLANAIVNIDNASIQNIKESKLPDLLENVRDLQKTSEENKNKINKSMYQALVAELQKNAIEPEEYSKRF